MGQNIMSAAGQWATRPADERFTSLADLRAAAESDRARCAEVTIAVRDVRAVPIDGGGVGLQGARNPAALNHYAFGQVASVVGAPGGYLRSLPADLAVQCINHGFDRMSEDGRREHHKLYVQRPGAEGGPAIVRALTSTSYTRVHDAPIVERLARLEDAGFSLPLDWSGKPAGAYRGDRDLFVFMTNGGSIVEDPTLRSAWSSGNVDSSPAMFRGVIVRNSEVGAASLSVESFLFRVVCGNHIIWSASHVQKFKRRHVGRGLASDFSFRLATIVREELNRAGSVDEQRIAKLADHIIGKDKDATIDVGRDLGLSRETATRAYDLAEQHEVCSPRSAWGYAQGITRASQAESFSEDRYAIDLAASRLLARIPVYA